MKQASQAHHPAKSQPNSCIIESSYHIPVLLEQSIDLLNLKPDGIYVDVTFGGGGHSRELLKRLQGGRLIAFDRDPDAKANLPEDDRITFIPEDFQFIETMLPAYGVDKVDGILADLGVSSHQFDTAERGFSFRFEGPLDMRMNPNQSTSAATLINEADPELLLSIFRQFGEVPNAKKVVRLITEQREGGRIQTTGHFETVIRSCIPAHRRSKYLAQVFQALRIAVNKEMESLTALLNASLKLLNPEGRLVIIAYHSLEDRLVKRFMKTGNLNGELVKDFYGKPITPWNQITRKAIQPSEAEIEMNPRARSARLRAAEMRERSE